MKKIVTPAFKIALIILLFLGIIGIVWALYYSPSARQGQNLAIADQFVEGALSPLVEKDEKYKNIQLGHYTGDGGCIWVLGEVQTEKDLIELKQLVKSTNPPLFVKWNVRVWERLVKEYKERGRCYNTRDPKRI
jgi:hypothetical protein